MSRRQNARATSIVHFLPWEQGDHHKSRPHKRYLTLVGKSFLVASTLLLQVTLGSKGSPDTPLERMRMDTGSTEPCTSKSPEHLLPLHLIPNGFGNGNSGTTTESGQSQVGSSPTYETDESNNAPSENVICLPYHESKFYKLSKGICMNEFTELGSGTYGRAFDLGTGDCIKQITLHKPTWRNIWVTMRELKLQSKFKHENVLGLDEVYLPLEKYPEERKHFVENGIILRMKKANKGDLKNLMMSGPFSNEQVQNFAFQMLSGMNYLHAAKILHRDLKPENILVFYDKITKQYTLKLADFGFARHWNYKNETQKEAMTKSNAREKRALTKGVQTWCYRAPEVAGFWEGANKAYGEKCDIFSIGCVILELLACSAGKVDTFVNPRSGSKNSKVHKFLKDVLADKNLEERKAHFSEWIIERNPDIAQDKTFQQLVDLCGRMICFDPDDRISAKVALEREEFKSFRQPDGTPLSEDTFMSLEDEINELFGRYGKDKLHLIMYHWIRKLLEEQST